MITEENQYKCKEDSMIMVWAFSRTTTEDERENEGWPEDILDYPKTKSEWKKATLWVGENTWEMMQACDFEDAKDLCKICQIMLKEKKSNAMQDNATSASKQKENG